MGEFAWFYRWYPFGLLWIRESNTNHVYVNKWKNFRIDHALYPNPNPRPVGSGAAWWRSPHQKSAGRERKKEEKGGKKEKRGERKERGEKGKKGIEEQEMY